MSPNLTYVVSRRPMRTGEGFIPVGTLIPEAATWGRRLDTLLDQALLTAVYVPSLPLHEQRLVAEALGDTETVEAIDEEIAVQALLRSLVLNEEKAA